MCRFQSVALAMFISLVLVGDAAAASDREACNGASDEKEKAISACTRLIKSGQFKNHDLAELLNDRGLAYYNTGDYDRAVADYGEAIRNEQKTGHTDIIAGLFYNRAIAYKVKGDYDRAIADYSEAIRLKPGFASAFTDRGRAYAAKGDRERAKADFNKALTMGTDDKGTWAQDTARKELAALVDGRDTCSSHSTDGGDPAIAACTRIINANTLRGSALADVYNDRAQAYDYGKHDYDRAADDYSRAIQLGITDRAKMPWLYWDRGMAYRLKGSPDQAIADFDQAIKGAADQGDFFYERGLAYADKGRYEQAIADMSAGLKYNTAWEEKGLSTYRRPDLILEARASLYKKMHKNELAFADYDELIRQADKSLKNYPDDYVLYYERGSYQHGKGELDPAITDYSQAIDLVKKRFPDSSDFSDYYLSRADAYYDKGDDDRAIADYREVIRQSPKDAVGWNNRGFAYNHAGEYDLAIADFDEALRLNPRMSSAFSGRGYVHNGKNEYDQAIADFNEAIRLDPSYANALVGRGFAYVQQRNYDRAIADANQALAIDPAHAKGLSLRGFVYNQKGDFDRAITDLNKSIEIDAKIALSYGYRGAAFALKGDFAKAVVDFDQAIKLDPKSKDFVKAREQAATSLATLQAAAPTPSLTTAAPLPHSRAFERRVALVIGNSNYPSAKLANPANDADDVATALRGVGFDVTERKDLTLSGFSEAISSFREKTKNADVALLYYAGHGMQLDGQNWLMPTDTDVSTAFDARHRNVSLQDMISDIETGVRTTLVFLDACRDNPLVLTQARGYADTRGLGRFDIKAAQTLVVFATRPNTTAADGNGRNSPFTAAFLQHLATPGVEVETLMKRVSATVIAATSGKQQPERLSGLDREFYFVKGK